MAALIKKIPLATIAQGCYKTKRMITTSGHNHVTGRSNGGSYRPSVLLCLSLGIAVLFSPGIPQLSAQPPSGDEKPQVQAIPQIGPSNEIKVLQSRNGLGLTLFTQKKYAEAEKEFAAALAIAEKIFGPDDPNRLTISMNLAESLYAQEKYAEAEKVYRAALAIAERILKPGNANRVGIMRAVANSLFQQKKYVEAGQAYQQIITIQQKTLGSENPETLFSRNQRAVSLYYQRRFDEAAKEFTSILAAQARVLGPYHKDTIQSGENLANARKEVQATRDEIRGLFSLGFYAVGLVGFGIPLSIKLNRKLRARHLSARPFR